MLKLSSTVLGISFLLDPTNVTRHSDGVTDGIFSLSSSDRLSDNAAFHSELMGFRPITANQNANVGKRVISFRKVFLSVGKKGGNVYWLNINSKKGRTSSKEEETKGRS